MFLKYIQKQCMENQGKQPYKATICPFSMKGHSSPGFMESLTTRNTRKQEQTSMAEVLCYLPPEIPVGTGLFWGTHTHWLSQKLPLQSASTCPDSTALEVPDFRAYLKVRLVQTLSPFPAEAIGTVSQAPCSRVHRRTLNILQLSVPCYAALDTCKI